MNCELGEIEKARLSVVVSKLVNERRFDLNFFDPAEKAKVNLKKKRRRRNFTKKRNVKVTQTYIEQKDEEIIPVTPLDPDELEKMKELTKEVDDEIKYTIDFSTQQSILDNSILSNLLTHSQQLLKYIKHDKVQNRFTLVPEICFENGLTYEENGFNILLLYLKFNINRTVRSYNQEKMFSITNNYVIVTKYIFNYLIKHNFDFEPYHFKVIGDYDKLYPSIEDIQTSNFQKIEYDEGIELPFGNSYVCFCRQKKNTQEICKTCELTSNLLNQLFNLNFCEDRLECNHDQCKLGNKIADYLVNLGFLFTDVRTSNHVGLKDFDNHIKDNLRFYKNKKYQEGFKSRKLLSSFQDDHAGLIGNTNTMLIEESIQSIKEPEGFGKSSIKPSKFASNSSFNSRLPTKFQ